MRTMLKFGLVFALVASVAGLAFAQGRRAPQPNRSAKPVLDPKMGLPGSRFPSFSPDGKTVVYTLYGDLWSMPANGGRSMRLTLNDAYDTKPLVTPDGKEIVFVSDRSGSYDLWVMPIDGDRIYPRLLPPEDPLAGPLHAAGAAPILVIGTTRDPATPYAWAQALASQLDSGVLVTRDGDGHVGYRRGNDCVDAAVEDYLVTGAVPEDGLTC